MLEAILHTYAEVLLHNGRKREAKEARRAADGTHSLGHTEDATSQRPVEAK